MRTAVPDAEAGQVLHWQRRSRERLTVTAVTGRRWRRLLTELECKGTVAGPGPWGRRQLERELQGADTSFSSNFGTHRESQSSEITVTRRQTRPTSTPRRTNIDIAKLPKHTKSYTLLLTSTATQCHSEHYWKHLVPWAGDRDHSHRNPSFPCTSMLRLASIMIRFTAPAPAKGFRSLPPTERL